MTADLSWQSSAACRTVNPEWFFPHDRPPGLEQAVERAKHVCRGCPVTAPCLELALSADWAGVWAGTATRQPNGQQSEDRVIAIDMPRTIVGFSSVEVCAMSGLTYRQLDYWSSKGTFGAEYEGEGSGSSRRYSTAALEQACYFAQLIKVGMKVPQAAQVARILVNGGQAHTSFTGYAPLCVHVQTADDCSESVSA